MSASPVEAQRSPKQIVKKIKIGTHNGRFHCDEVLACAMLQQLPQYRDAKILRTREASQLEKCDIVIDVGGVLDTERMRFDHHMPDFKLTMADFFPDVLPKLKLSSAGLIYAVFGHRIIGEVINKPESHPDVDIIFKHFYKSFIAEVDAFDNGIPVADGDLKFQMNSDICKRVANFNPPWNRPEISEEEGFAKGLALAKAEFLERLNAVNDHWLPARDLVKEAIEQRFTCHPSGMIIDLKNSGCPWKDHFFNLEKELVLVDPAVAELDSSHPFKQQPVLIITQRREQFSVVCIPLSLSAPFSKRVPFPEAWAGKREAELEAISAVSGSVFVHTNCFMGVTKSYDGAIDMACKVLKAAGYLQ